MVETTGSNTEIWMVPSEPLEIAVLYDSYMSRTACGHTVPLRRMVHRLQEGDITCPICQKTVGYVSDGAADFSKQDAVVVIFKYGKTVYRLSVAKPLRTRPSWWWGFLEPHWKTNHITAQKRMSDVLGISRGIKILHKGKVLYPLQLGSSDAMEEELSNMLVSISKTGATVSLTVMGTPTERQNMWLKNENEHKFHSSMDQPKDLWTLVTTTTVADVFHFGIYLFYQSVHFLGSFAWYCFDTVRNRVAGRMQSPSQQGHDHVQ